MTLPERSPHPLIPAVFISRGTVPNMKNCPENRPRRYLLALVSKVSGWYRCMKYG